VPSGPFPRQPLHLGESRQVDHAGSNRDRENGEQKGRLAAAFSS
jgi:hypothetical protein